MSKLSYNDYVDVLQFYKMDTAGLKKKEVKIKAEHLLATKLCKCIKNIKRRKGTGKGKSTSTSTSTTKMNESRAIAICYDSVIRKKGLKTFKFKCKKGARLLGKKGTRKLLVIKRI